MNKQIHLFEGYDYPTTSEQEVLLNLILQGHSSIFDFPYLSGYRTRISELQTKKGLFLERTLAKRFNKFGNVYTYAIHKLPSYQKDKAIELYNSLVSRK